MLQVLLVCHIEASADSLTMTATTTIRLPPELRGRVNALAEATGRSAHSLIIEAVERYAAYEEQMRDLVQEALAADADIERTGARVNVCVAPLVLRLDREGLAVALRNLVSNALKFTKPQQVPVLDIGSTETEAGHVLWVRDQGVGFDMKYHDRIFGIFQRLQRSEDYAGTGVGLALVAKAVQRMGGRVWAESQPGQGATFYMEFPR